MLNKAKQLAMKNKDKIAKSVDKATDVIDKKTGGKHTDKLKKLDDAAQKFAGRSPATDAAAPPAGTATASAPIEPEPPAHGAH